MRASPSLALALALGLGPGVWGVACDPARSPPIPSADVPAPTAPPPEPPPTAIATADGVPAPPPGPPPLRAVAPILDLDVPGHPAAVVSVPLGATSPRPVLVATHGNYDRPEWQCEVWRGIVGDTAFVLCPRGIPRPDSPAPDDIRFTYADNRALERELDAGLDALRAAYAEHAAPDPVVYTGFSLGAIMGVSIMARRPERYRRAVLVEGGHDKWTPATTRAFAAGEDRTRRVLFACGQRGCVADARRAAALLEKAGVATKVVHGEGVGHGYGGPVAEQVLAAWPWLQE